MKDILWAFRVFGFKTGVTFAYQSIVLGLRRFLNRKHRKMMMAHYAEMESVKEKPLVSYDDTIN